MVCPSNLLNLRSPLRPRRHRGLALLCAAVLFVPGALRAQPFWEAPGGPSGFPVTALFARSGGLVIASTQQGSTFRSTDNGNSWNTNLSGLPSVHAFATKGGTSLFAATQAGAFFSTDDGQTWTQPSASSNPLFGANILDMTVGGNGALFCTPFYPAGGSGLFQSTDNGLTWFRGKFPSNIALQVTHYDAKTSSLFSGAADTTMWRSPDNGATWVRKNTGLSATQFTRLASDPVSGALYCGSSVGLFRSINNGDVWTRLTLPISNVATVFVSRLGHVYVADAGASAPSVFRSTDNGVTWQTLVTGLGGARVTSFALSAEGILFAGSLGGTVFRSRRPIDALFAASPASIPFGRTPVAQQSVRTVTIQNPGIGSLVIDTVVSTDAAFTVSPASVTIAAGSLKIFTVTFQPPDHVAYAGTLIFSHNAQGSPDSVKLSGLGVRPIFKATPASLDFNTMKAGGKATLPLLVTNSGNDTLAIQSVLAFDPQDFSVLPSAPVFIEPKGARSFDVTFTPSAAKAYVGHGHSARIYRGWDRSGLSRRPGRHSRDAIHHCQKYRRRHAADIFRRCSRSTDIHDCSAPHGKH